MIYKGVGLYNPCTVCTVHAL